jgi:hypothetical protein
MTNINVNAGTVNINGNIVSVKIGMLDLLASGSVLVHDTSPVEFKIGNLSFELMFYEDKSISTNKIEFENPATKTNTLFIKTTNFNNILGTMNTSPLQVGTLSNRILYFSFIVYTIENNNRVIHYSWFLGQTIDEPK